MLPVTGGDGVAFGPTTDDALLGGRVRLRQPRAGTLRAGLDAVALAAAVPARDGETVLELGCGGGAAFLCLLARVPGARTVAVERDPALAALAAANAAANGWAGRASVRVGDVRDLRAVLDATAPADHGMANPPWWPSGGATPSPVGTRAEATHADGADADLDDWARALARGVKAGGSATFVLPAALFDRGASALVAAGFGGPTLRPMWPRAGREAKRVLVSARRGGRGPARVLPGLVLHNDGGWTAAARAVLADGAALD